FIPVIILALTGVYLSAEKFELLQNAELQNQEIITSEESQIFENLWEIPFFNETPLSEVRKIDFPFSEDAEDFFHIALKDREINLNQKTGAIVSSADYPFVVLASRLSLVLHTGEGNVLWSIVLLIASASIIFFMYSGFVMTLKSKIKVVVKTVMPNKDECEFVILVGSETGTTLDFATLFYNELINSGKQVLMSELNKYSVYAKAKHLIFIT